MEKEKNFQTRISKENIALFITLLAVFAAAGAFLLTAAKEQEYPYDVRQSKRLMNLKDVELIERAEDGNGMCMVYVNRDINESPYLVSDQYIIQHEIIYSDNVRKKNIIIYNIEKDTENVITYEDYEAMLPEHLRASYNTGRVYCWQDQGKWYTAIEFWWRAGKEISGEVLHEPWMVIEVDSGEIIGFVTEEYAADKATKDSEADQEYNRTLDIFRRSTILENHGMSFKSWKTDTWLHVSGKNWHFARGVWSGEVMISLPGYTLPENNEALYSKFPGLKKYRQTKTKYPRTKPEYEVEIHLKGRLKAEEILRLILEDGEEISFEDIVVYPEYSIDGEWHTIECFDDWNKWYAGDEDKTYGWLT